MVPLSTTVATVVVLGASALAQGDLKSRLQPVHAALKRAGTYHVATGTWTRHGSTSNVTGPDTIYNNRCVTGYFGAMIAGERWQHRSRVPSDDTDAPTTPSIFYGSGRNDEFPGCAASYLVNGFQFAYCSSRPGGSVNTQQHDFADSYTLCGGGDMPITVSQSFTITGLPGGTATASQICWIVDVDLDAATVSFTLSADGDGDWDGPDGLLDQFGWSMGPVSAQILTDATGPIIAGNYTWTGGATVGALTPCTGTDGTIWDSPVNLAEAGTGMLSSDFFRITGTATTAPSGPGCYYFGGTVHSDFYLELFCNAPGGCGPAPGFTICEPGIGGVMSCPCGNPPSGGGRGCNNSSFTGGATMTDTGTASLATDTVVFTTTDERPTALSIVLQGSSSIPAGIMFGDGVRCMGGLKRLYVKAASGGSITAPQGADPTVSARSATLGDPISPGDTRYYQTYYRDPLPNGCPPSPGGSTFNITSGRQVSWYI